MSCTDITEKAVFDRIITRVQPWLPASTVQQLKNKKSLTPVEIIRLLSILPPQAYTEFLDIPSIPLVFPKDHNAHFLQSEEWFYLALNLTAEDGTRMGALSTIVRRSIDPYDPDALFAPVSPNEVFRSSFSITSAGKENQHWYFPDQGNYLGDGPGQYFPGIVNSLPYVIINNKNQQGLLPKAPNQNSDFSWVINDTKTGASIDVQLTCEAPLLLQGPKKDGILVMPGTEVNYMYYSFPYLTVQGTLTLPGGTTKKVSGSGWLDHQGGVIKPVSGLLAYLLEWSIFFGTDTHRLAWIWVQAQFPTVKTFITGAAIGINPRDIKKGDKFPWIGTVMQNGKSEFYKSGELTVKNTFKSPDLSVTYVVELEVKINDEISFTSKSILLDQRVYPADQGEIYEGAADALLNDKTSGTGYIENMAFSNYEELVKQQYAKLGISDQSVPNKLKSTTGPIITIVVLVLLIFLLIWFFFLRRKVRVIPQ